MDRDRPFVTQALPAQRRCGSKGEAGPKPGLAASTPNSIFDYGDTAAR